MIMSKVSLQVRMNKTCINVCFYVLRGDVYVMMSQYVDK